MQINGATGEKITNAQILKHAVSIARALVASGARGKNVMIVMRNHQYTAALFFAVQFAGTVPFIMDPNTTACKFKMQQKDKVLFEKFGFRRALVW